MALEAGRFVEAVRALAFYIAGKRQFVTARLAALFQRMRQSWRARRSPLAQLVHDDEGVGAGDFAIGEGHQQAKVGLLRIA